MTQLAPNITPEANLSKHVPAQASKGFCIAKRTLDVFGAIVCLIPALPVMILCALWIKACDRGPVFYYQWRVGQDGWLFKIVKLRTMSLAAERHGAQLAQRNDPRVLPGCAWMRTSHLDELPQLLNILAGHMSLVGPRPERPEIIEQLRPHLPCIDHRLAGPPGLTGLAQIRSGYSNDLAGAKRKLAYDLFYLRRRCHRLGLLTEIGLILRTLPKFWDKAAH